MADTLADILRSNRADLDEWAEKMDKTHNCHQCRGCGLWAVWTPKRPGDD